MHAVDDFTGSDSVQAVATDIVNGQEAVLGTDRWRVHRASMAVPAAFAAVAIDDRLLVDGGMANNLPISVVRDMGADIVIAVDISTPLRAREQLGSALTVLNAQRPADSAQH